MVDQISYSHQLIRTGNVPRQAQGFLRGRMPWLPEDKEALIVDVGCAWGTLLLDLRSAGYTNLVGVDNDGELARQAAQRCGVDGIRIVHADAIDFFETSELAIDRVLLFHVLEHFSIKDGTRLLSAIRECLSEQGQLVVEVPNMASVTGINMQCSDLTHATAFTEYSLKQLLENAGFGRVSVVCQPPPLRLWRLGRPGSGIGWRANRGMHSLLYKVTNSGPRPSCFCPALLVTAAK